MVSQAATPRVKASKSNNIKLFIVFIENDLLYFGVTGIETEKILDFSPIGWNLPDRRIAQEGCGRAWEMRAWGKPGSEGAHFPAWWKLTVHFQRCGGEVVSVQFLRGRVKSLVISDRWHRVVDFLCAQMPYRQLIFPSVLSMRMKLLG